jgi:membrane protease YdiL (CAAX protease family)
MSNPGHAVGSADVSSSSLTRKSSRIAIVGWASLLWLTSVFAYGVLIILDKAFVHNHAWGELLVVNGTWVLGSFLLLARDQISWQAAGVCLPAQPISWPLNIAVLVGVQLVGSTILFALKAPDSFVSSLSPGQRLLWICALVPASEELFMRGWFQTAYARTIGPAKATSAVLVSAAFFAGMHLFASPSPMRTAVTVFAAFLSGLVYAQVRQASGSLLPAVVMHSAFNVSGWLMARPLWLLVSKIRG